MLHILLGILKVIGIILAVIIGLIILIVLVVLLAAFQYEVKAAADGDIKSLAANVKFSWLFHLISGYVIYKEQDVQWQVKVAWKKLNEPKEAEATVQQEKAAERLVPQEKAAERVVQQEKAVERAVQQEKAVERAVTQEKAPEAKAKKAKAKADVKKESFTEKIRCSIQKISAKIKEIKELKDQIIGFLTAENHKRAFRKLLKELLRLLKKLKPKKLQANVAFGFEDPYKTGSILAYLSMLYPFYGDNINIVPDFTEQVIKGDIYIKGHVRLSYMVSMGIRLILDRNIRFTIKDIMKFIAKK